MALVLVAVSCAYCDAQNFKMMNASWNKEYIKVISNLENKDYYARQHRRRCKHYKDSTSIESLCTCYLGACDELLRCGEYVSSIQLLSYYCDDMKRNLNTSAGRVLMADFKNDLGVCYTRLGLYQKALPLLKEALICFSSARKKALAYDNLYILYYSQGDTAMAVKLLNKALEIALKHHYPESAGLYNNLALISFEQNNDTQAMAYWNKALRLNDDQQFDRSYIYSNIGQLFIHRGQYKYAEGMLLRAVRRQRKKTFDADNIETLLLLAETKGKLQKNMDAIRIIDGVEKVLMHLPASEMKAQCLKKISDLYFLLKDTLRAVNRMQQYVQMNDSISSVRNNGQLHQLLAGYEVEQMRNDNLELRHEADVYKLHMHNRTVLSSILVVSAVFLIVILVILIRKRRSDREKNIFIQEQKDRIMEYERNQFIREKAEMNANIHEKNRELTSYVIDFSSINEFHNSISQRLKKLSEGKLDDIEYTKKQLGMLMMDLQHHNDQQLGNDFRKYFNEVSPDFFVLLAGKHPNLTEGDRRLCAYLFLGLSSKEIASLTFHDIRSVEKSRQRLRKKLGLEMQASISDYLRSFYYYQTKDK